MCEIKYDTREQYSFTANISATLQSMHQNVMHHHASASGHSPHDAPSLCVSAKDLHTSSETPLYRGMADTHLFHAPFPDESPSPAPHHERLRSGAPLRPNASDLTDRRRRRHHRAAPPKLSECAIETAADASRLVGSWVARGGRWGGGGRPGCGGLKPITDTSFRVARRTSGMKEGVGRSSF